ncbi:MAG: DNA ligase D [Myxococcaceae bacterium]
MARRRTPSNLETYRQKRNFEVTSEPAPAPVPERATSKPSFMIHKHDASRLHYDLRLEMDEALASWAIPKGPSYDPAVKRLAVQTEDHPLEYGSFEGRIPDAEYGGGDSLIWERGTYDTFPPGQASQQRKKGHLVIDLEGEKLKGRWHLVRTRPGPSGKAQWIFFKAKDGKEDPSFDVVEQRPESVASGRRITRGPVTKKLLGRPHASPEVLLQRVWPPMKATLSTPDSAEGDEFVFEVKYDGYRALAAIVNGKLAFQSRNALDFESRFPEIARALKRMRIGEVVLDGEVVAVDRSGRSNFQSIQSGDSEHRFYVFDLLWLDGEDLRKRPLEDRRDLLESVLSNIAPPIMLAERVEGHVEQAMAQAKEANLEGVIAKRKGSIYEPKRSPEWLKLKLHQAQEFVIVGYTPISNGANEIGALLVGVREGKDYVFAGKVGTGFSSKLRKELRKKLDAIAVDSQQVKGAPRYRDAIWVEPRYVAQLEFTEWTRDGKLRHPSFQGLRDDKDPSQVVREIPEEVGHRKAPTKKAARMARAHTRDEEEVSDAEVINAPAKSRSKVPEKDYHLTHGDRVLFPKSGYTKKDVYEYHRAVADVMVPALEGRPLALQLWPEGIQKEGIFRQTLERMGAPEWLTRAEVQSERRKLDHPVADRPEALLWLANRSALTLHMWHSRVPHLSQPDWVVFDLDPGEGTWAELIKVARTLHGMLEHLGLESVVKTSGKRGLHVLVPMAPGHTHQDALEFAVAVTRTMERGLSDIATTERMKKDRHGRLYLDAFQNGEGKTIVAPYTIRAVEGAPVSAPLKWSEVTEKLDPSAFTIKTMPKRLAKVGDLFAPALRGHQRLPRFPGGKG